MTTLLFLDDYHVGDPLFLADLGRRLSRRDQGGGTVIVHSARDAVNREMEGIPAGGRSVVTERAIREANQGITRRLTEEGVPAVSIQGSDRRLLVRDGTIRVRQADWLLKSVSLGAVPVISPLVHSISGIEGAEASECAAAVAHLFGGSGGVHAVVFCSNRKRGLSVDGALLDSVSIADAGGFDDIIDVNAARRLVTVARCLTATNSAGLADGSAILGTVISE